jgi:hypothetical protein
METQAAQQIKDLLSLFFEKGFTFDHTYQKGGDSSCVYIYRFIKNQNNYFEWRETSGEYEIHLFVCANGEYRFPDPLKKYKKQVGAFKRKHLFKRPTVEEKRELFGKLLLQEFTENPTEFFGIKL